MVIGCVAFFINRLIDCAIEAVWDALFVLTVPRIFSATFLSRGLEGFAHAPSTPPPLFTFTGPRVTAPCALCTLDQVWGLSVLRPDSYMPTCGLVNM